MDVFGAGIFLTRTFSARKVDHVQKSGGFRLVGRVGSLSGRDPRSRTFHNGVARARTTTIFAKSKEASQESAGGGHSHVALNDFYESRGS